MFQEKIKIRKRSRTDVPYPMLNSLAVLYKLLYYIDVREVPRFTSKRKIVNSLCELKTFISLCDVTVPTSSPSKILLSARQ